MATLRDIAALALAGLSLAAGSSALAAPATVEGLSLQAEDAVAVLRLELNGKPKARVFTLSGPPRAVIDLSEAALAAGTVLPAPTGPIRGVRKGPLPAGGLRLVLDLERELRVTQRNLGPSDRGRYELLIELSDPQPIGASPTEPLGRAAPEVSNPPIRAAHAPADSGRDVVVAIDPGHGGVDPGAIGRRGTQEKDVVLAIALELARHIDAEPGMRAFLTRDGDYFLTLRERIRRARNARADMFLSVHADSVPNGDAAGASVYVLSEKGASDEQARWLAERENAADLKGGVKLDDKDDLLATVLLDLSQSATIAESMRAAERVLRTIDRTAAVHKSRVQQAGFVVLKSPDIPSMLVETAYISNPRDERALQDAAHRERLARAIFLGVRDYFRDHPPDGSYFALQRRGAAPATARTR